MKKVIGADIWNMAITNDVGRCVSTSGGGLNEHIPVVIITDEGENEQILSFGEPPTRLQGEDSRKRHLSNA